MCPRPVGKETETRAPTIRNDNSITLALANLSLNQVSLSTCLVYRQAPVGSCCTILVSLVMCNANLHAVAAVLLQRHIVGCSGYLKPILKIGRQKRTHIIWTLGVYDNSRGKRIFKYGEAKANRAQWNYSKTDQQSWSIADRSSWKKQRTIVIR